MDTQLTTGQRISLPDGLTGVVVQHEGTAVRYCLLGSERVRQTKRCLVEPSWTVEQILAGEMDGESIDDILARTFGEDVIAQLVGGSL